MVENGHSLSAAARAGGVCRRTARKWVARHKAEGRTGLTDRSSRPRRLYRPTPQDMVDRVIELRRHRLTGSHIARKVGISPATVSRVLKRAGLSRLKDLEPAEPVRRYERDDPGDLIHLDIKKLGRFEKTGHRITGNRRSRSSRSVGWERVHVCVDDASRIAFTDIYPDEKAISAVAFLKAAVAYYKSLGIIVQRVMTDNGPCYKSHAFTAACRELGLRHLRTRPFTPQTNGKAERFIQTALREWAYARAYETSDQRAADLPIWTHMYNWHRPHSGIKHQAPISRLNMSRDNLLRLHS
jgi:transposase InsO family protein